MDAISTFAEHVARTTYDDLPRAAVLAVKTFVPDTLGVGIAESGEPWAPWSTRWPRSSPPWSPTPSGAAASAATSSSPRLKADNAERLIGLVDGLETVSDVRERVALTVP